VDTSANIFSRACADGGLWVLGKREYFSNIKGEHSYFVVRVSEEGIRALLNRINVLTSFDEETVARHFDEVTDDGAIIFDSALLKKKVEDIPTLEQRIKDELSTRFGEGAILEALLKDAEGRGVRLYPLPYAALLNTISSRSGEKRMSVLGRMINVIAVSASFALLSYDLEELKKSIVKTFGGKKKVGEINEIAAEISYDYFHSNFKDSFGYKLQRIQGKGRRLLLNGNQAVALGKIAAGLRFQTYYPITPAADESTYLERYERLTMKDGTEGSVVVVQTEDEISAITMAIGSALSGARSATCTSGPGFSLMAEGLGWAGINEVPLVVTEYQRAGPSTGMPTRHEQGDLRFSLFGGHGDFPRIVLASGDVEECFYDANLAFNYAERYQLPVIHLVDKAMANSTLTVPYFDVDRIAIDRGELYGNGKPFVLAEGDEYRRFQFTENGISPRVPFGTPGAVFWNTGDEHNELGHITEDPVVRDRMMEKRMGKLELALREIPEDEQFHYYGSEKPELLLVSWGSTKGSILEAMDRLGSGADIAFLQIRLIHPFPSARVRELIQRARRFAVMEMNYTGQLASTISEHTGRMPDSLIVKYNGRPITADEAYEVMSRMLKGRGLPREVLTHGA